MNEVHWNNIIIELNKYLKTVPRLFAHSISKLDILQGDALLGGLTCTQLKKRFGIPFVYVTHGLNVLDAIGSGSSRKWINLCRKYESDILHTADYIVVESVIMKHYINKTYNIPEEKMFVVPNGADLIKEKAEYKLPMNIIYGGCFAYHIRKIR